MYLIVSRHPATVAFIRANDKRFADAPVITGNASADDVRRMVVAGNLPLHLAANCREIVAVEFSGAPPRGMEYTLEDMQAAGARLSSYVVITPKRVTDAINAARDGGSDWAAHDVADALGYV